VPRVTCWKRDVDACVKGGRKKKEIDASRFVACTSPGNALPRQREGVELVGGEGEGTGRDRCNVLLIRKTASTNCPRKNIRTASIHAKEKKKKKRERREGSRQGVCDGASDPTILGFMGGERGRLLHDAAWGGEEKGKSDLREKEKRRRDSSKVLRERPSSSQNRRS